MEVRGAEKISRDIRSLARRYPKAFAAALYRLGVSIMSEALPMTPVEFAVLRSSGYVSPPSTSGHATSVEVGFGTVYAVPQHERMDYKHPRGGGPKYLARAIDKVSSGALATMRRWLANNPDARYQRSGIPTSPTVANSTARTHEQKSRFARASANVRKRTNKGKK